MKILVDKLSHCLPETASLIISCMSSYLLVPAFVAADIPGGQAAGGLPDVLNLSARFCAHPQAGREWTTNPQHAAPRLYHAGYSTLAPLFLVASILDWLWLSQSSLSYTRAFTIQLATLFGDRLCGFLSYTFLLNWRGVRQPLGGRVVTFCPLQRTHAGLQPLRWHCSPGRAW